MAQTGFTPILMYGSTTASAVPTAANLTTSANGVELAVNAADGKLYYKDSGGTVQVLATKDASGGSFTNATVSGNLTLSGGTANGVAYLNGSKVLTTGGALTFDGTNFATTGNAQASAFVGPNNLTSYMNLAQSNGLVVRGASGSPANQVELWTLGSVKALVDASGNFGIGTSSITDKLTVQGGGNFRVASGNVGIALTGASWAYSTYLNAADSSYRIYSSTGGDRVVLDASGNLGLGVTPSAWGSGWKVIDFAGGGRIYESAGFGSVGLDFNAYNNGTNWIYQYSNYASRAELNNSGQFVWYTAPSGTAGNAISFTQAMTLDASGRLGVGTTNPSWRIHAVGAGEDQAEIQSQNTSTVGNSRATVRVKSAASTYGGGLMMTNATDAAYPTSALCVYNYDAQPLVFGTNNTERVRIASDGSVMIGQTFSSGMFTVNDTAGAGTYSQAGTFRKSSNNTTSYYQGARVVLQNTSATVGNFSSLGFQTANGNDYAAIWGIATSHTGGTGAGHLVFGTSNGDGVAVERARINSSGQLLVGGTSAYTTATKLVAFGSQSLGIDNTASTSDAGIEYKTSLGFWKAGVGIGSSSNAFVIYDLNAGAERARIDSGGNFILTNSGGNNRFYSTGVYNITGGAAANVIVGADGGLYRSTSSLKYKRNVQDAAHGLADLLKLRSVTYQSKNENEQGSVYGGLIAEEVHEAGLTEFVQYSEDGSPDALAYANMVSLCIKAIQEQQAIIEQLKADVAALKGA